MNIAHQLNFLELTKPGTTRDLLQTCRSLEEFANSHYSPYSNPSLAEFVESNATGNQRHQESPLPEHLVAGKNTYAYDAHTYHTKVPPEAIESLLEHYTRPGEVILDPFCGSGMTGLAALRTGRKPILIDLSPAATFISLNFLTPMDQAVYMKAVRSVIAQTQEEEEALYGTHCRTCGKLVPMNYLVWSYGLICSYCHKEFILWDVARDEKDDVRESKVKTEFDCPYCRKHLEKKYLKRTGLYPVQVGYKCCDSGRRESTAVPDEFDLRRVLEIENEGVPDDLWYPTAQFPPGMNTQQPINHGLKSVNALYTTRQLRAVARLWDIARRWKDKDISLKLMFTVTSLYQRVTRLSEFRFWGGSSNTANYNVPMIFNEQNVFQVFERKARTIQGYFSTWNTEPDVPFCISTQSATDLRGIPNNSIDYIFTDPPFGGNINYSEMNFLWEAWLGVHTDPENEAIINRVQRKSLDDYRELMTEAFVEMHRVLKPERWLTVMFHNSSDKVWSAIQRALSEGGFSIESVQTLDKRHGTFKQFVSPNAVGYDLLIHCRKGQNHSGGLFENNERASEASVREFAIRNLRQNPDDFMVQYLHVNRRNELDTRKLYSFWLKERLGADEIINLGYEQFREIVNNAIESSFGDDALLSSGKE